ncbi:MAG: DUF6705 family protein [Psychroflexus sp.]
MKITIFILALLLNLSCNTAQEVTLEKEMKVENVKRGTYYKTDKTLLNKYLGIWSMTINNKTFKFEISKKKTEVDGIYIDRIAGKYYYDGKTDIYKNDSVYECSAMEYGLDVLEKGSLRFRFWDYDYKKYGKLEFKLLQDNKASFKLRESYNPDNDIKGFSIPTEMILTRN